MRRSDVFGSNASALHPDGRGQSRLSLIDRLSAKVPGCKFALLCDENSDPELARQVVCARQDRRIDAFLYASVTPAYLVAAMDAL